MANYKDMSSIVEAKRNEIESKGLDKYYGDPDNYAVTKAYPNYLGTERLRLAELLEATMVPKYVRLAKILRELSDYNSQRAKAAVILANEHSSVKTIYKELKQVEKRSKKLDRRRAAQLNKYKDVRKFMGSDLSEVLEKFDSKDISKYDISRLTSFFDSCVKLNFLRKSKLTKHVR